MHIVFNGQEKEVAAGVTLKSFLDDAKISIEGSAAACDEEIIPKSKWSTFLLKDGMHIDVFSLVAGG